MLGNRKNPDNENIMKDTLNNFYKLGCNMSIKLHYMHSQIDFFLENLGAVSEGQGERFHLNIMIMESKNQGRWNTNIMADYCWILKKDEPDRNHNKKILKRSFEGCRIKYHKKF